MEKEILESLLEEAQVDEDIEVRNVDDNIVELTNGDQYQIFNEKSRNEAMQNICLETFPYFNASFLASFTKLPQAVFENLDESISSEDVEKILNATGNSIEEFAEKAAEIDGYEHFLSHYDGTTELELVDNLYAYRID